MPAQIAAETMDFFILFSFQFSIRFSRTYIADSVKQALMNRAGKFVSRQYPQALVLEVEMASNLKFCNLWKRVLSQHWEYWALIENSLSKRKQILTNVAYQKPGRRFLSERYGSFTFGDKSDAAHRPLLS
jgi:hypothetical protein